MFRWVKKLTVVSLHICQTKSHESQIIHLLPSSTRFSLSVANYSPRSLDDPSSSPSLPGTIVGNQEISKLKIPHCLCERDFWSGDWSSKKMEQNYMDPHKHGFHSHLTLLNKTKEMLISRVHVVMRTFFLGKIGRWVSRVRWKIYN